MPKASQILSNSEKMGGKFIETVCLHYKDIQKKFVKL